MPKKLIIRCTKDFPLQVEWLIVSEFGTVHQGVQTSHLRDLPAATSKQQTIVIVPSDDVSLYRVKLPPTNRNRLLKAIPFALEESLVEDINDLHFALASPANDAGYPVAVVRKSLMEYWLKPFIEHSIPIDYLIPEVLCLPLNDKQWSLYQDNELILLRTGSCDGYVIDKDNLVTFLAITSEEVTNQQPTEISLYSAEPLRLATNHIPTHEPTLQFYAKQLSTLPTLNLMQGDFRANRELAEVKHFWLIAGGLAAAWILVTAIFTFSQFFYWHHNNSTLQQQINKIYYSVFPTATSVVDPKLRMQRKINQLQSSQSGGAFLSLLGMTGEVLHKIPSDDLQLLAMTFVNDSLSIAINANDFATVQELVQQLQIKGLSVNQDSATTKGNKVQASLTISLRGER